MKKIFVYILIALILAGAAVAALSYVPAVEWTALGVTFASAGALCVATYKKSQKKRLESCSGDYLNCCRWFRTWFARTCSGCSF